MKKTKVILAAIIAAALFTGCSSASSGTAGTPAATTDAINSGLNDLQSVFTDAFASSTRSFSTTAQTKAAFGTNWTDSNVKVFSIIGGDSILDNDATAGNGNGLVTVPNLFSEALDPATAYSSGARGTVFGRLESTFKIVCILGVMTNGNVTVGAGQTLDFTSALGISAFEKCDSGGEGAPAPSITYDVTVPADTTLYDLHVYFPPFGQDFYFKINSTVVNVLSHESDSGRQSRAIASLDRTTGNLRMSYFASEYVSGNVKAGDNFEFHRAYVDGATKAGTLMSAFGNYHASTPTNYSTANEVRVFSVGTGNDVEAYLAIKSIPGTGSGTAISDAYGCVNKNTGAMVSDNDLTCAGGITGISANTFNSMVAVAAVAPESGINATSHLTAVPFTNASDIATAAEF